MDLKLFLIALVFLVSCREQENSCTDSLANNFDSAAVINDGSCTYNQVSVSPESSFELSDEIRGTSGLIFWEGLIWTHNDRGNAKLFGLNKDNGEVSEIIDLNGEGLTDWEDITQDGDYIYLGDFGNNANGDRTDLKILRVLKSSMKSGSPQIDTIWFSYADQIDLTPKAPNQTDFDCEASVVIGDSIYLFTKEWVSARTSVHVLPSTPGTHEAVKKGNYNVEGMITGATMLESKNLLVLCGYTILLRPFIYLIYDFKGTDFFSGNKRKVFLSIPFHQVEGITTMNGATYYISNEEYNLQSIAEVSQKLHVFELESFLPESR
jgi:hypothetical protein